MVMRLFRILIALAAFISLLLARVMVAICALLCLATIALWIQSYRHFTRVDYSTFKVDGNNRLGSSHVLYIYHGETDYMYHRVPKARGLTFATPPDRLSFRRFPLWKGRTRWWSFAFGRGTLTGPPALGGHEDYVNAVIPIWSIFVVTAALPAFWLLRIWRRLRKGKDGLCARCGYDLRASPDQCPECGQVRQPGPVAAV